MPDLIKIVEQKAEVIPHFNTVDEMFLLLEEAGRTCYNSRDRIKFENDKYVPNYDFFKMLIKNGHESVLEHASITIRFTCSRSISHELVRHRLFSYSQISQRFVDTGKNDRVPFIKAMVDLNPEQVDILYNSCRASEIAYKALRESGATPQFAREVLPNNTATEIFVTGNLRQWRHTFKLRTNIAAHPMMIDLMRSALEQVQEIIPVIFDDIGE